jgi:hypothetical protein
MVGLHHDSDALGMQVIFQPVSNLYGQAFLDLQLPGEEIDDAGELRQAEDACSRNVADVSDALERQKVMLTERHERDVASENQFVVLVVVRERGEIERLRRHELGERLSYPSGSVNEMLRRRVLTEGQEKITHGLLSCL